MLNFNISLPLAGLIVPSPAATAQFLLCLLSLGHSPNPIKQKEEQRALSLASNHLHPRFHPTPISKKSSLGPLPHL